MYLTVAAWGLGIEFEVCWCQSVWALLESAPHTPPWMLKPPPKQGPLVLGSSIQKNKYFLKLLAKILADWEAPGSNLVDAF